MFSSFAVKQRNELWTLQALAVVEALTFSKTEVKTKIKAHYTSR